MRRESQRLLIATGNRGKFEEIDALLGGHGFDLVSQAALGIAEVEETASTFVENALLKARHAARVSGLPTLADDSGLLVDALHGGPGVRSARFAGERPDAAANNARLLEVLHEVPDQLRTARFYCVLVLLRTADDPQPLICEGTWIGAIVRAPRGQNGFGYDPLFFDAALGATAAEMDGPTKARVSHRGQALSALRVRAPEWFAECASA